MRRLLTLCLISLAACSDPPTPRCPPSAMRALDPPVLVALAGAPLTLDLRLEPAVFCPEGNPIATAVTTEILDPESRPVPHESTAPTSSNSTGYATKVTFTPTAPGVYAASARFEPSLGLVQRQVQLANDRANDAPVSSVRLGASCDDVRPLDDALWCRRGQQLSTYRDGGLTGTEVVTAALTSRNVGWTWNGATVARVLDVDGGLERSELPVTGSFTAFGASRSRFVLGAGTQLTEVLHLDGGLTLRTRTVPAPITSTALALAGDDVIGWSTATHLCAGSADGGVACVTNTFAPLAAEDDALWLRGVESGIVGLAHFSSEGREPTVVLVPSQPELLLSSSAARPSFTALGRFFVVRADDLTFEGWRPPAGLVSQHVTASHVVLQSASGDTIIYRR